VYVDWVKSQQPNLYLPELRLHIAQHYHSILASHPDLVAQWRDYLLALIIERSQQYDRLVVEGYLLADCRDAYEQELTKRSVQVFHIHAVNYSYSTTRRLTDEQIASLGEPQR
jgi:hypothetical protein